MIKKKEPKQNQTILLHLHFLKVIFLSNSTYTVDSVSLLPCKNYCFLSPVLAKMSLITKKTAVHLIKTLHLDSGVTQSQVTSVPLSICIPF